MQSTPPAKGSLPPPVKAQCTPSTKVQSTPPAKVQSIPPSKVQPTTPAKVQPTTPTKLQTTQPTKRQVTQPAKEQPSQPTIERQNPDEHSKTLQPSLTPKGQPIGLTKVQPPKKAWPITPTREQAPHLPKNSHPHLPKCSQPPSQSAVTPPTPCKGAIHDPPAKVQSIPLCYVRNEKRIELHCWLNTFYQSIDKIISWQCGK